MNDHKKLPREQILAALGGLSEAVYLELVRLFQEQTRGQLSQAAAALAEENFPLFGTIMHGIKGAAANLRLQPVVEPSAALERLAKECGEPAKIKELFLQLQEEFVGLEREFPAA